MLFDEVTSALDPELVGEVLGVLRQLARDGMTMIVVTHEMGFARRSPTASYSWIKAISWMQGAPGDIFANPGTSGRSHSCAACASIEKDVSMPEIADLLIRKPAPLGPGQDHRPGGGQSRFQAATADMQAKTVIDAGGRLAVPGFIEPHIQSRQGDDQQGRAP